MCKQCSCRRLFFIGFPTNGPIIFLYVATSLSSLCCSAGGRGKSFLLLRGRCQSVTLSFTVVTVKITSTQKSRCRFSEADPETGWVATCQLTDSLTHQTGRQQRLLQHSNTVTWTCSQCFLKSILHINRTSETLSNVYTLTLTTSCPRTPPTTAHTGDISEKQ